MSNSRQLFTLAGVALPLTRDEIARLAAPLTAAAAGPAPPGGMLGP